MSEDSKDFLPHLRDDIILGPPLRAGSTTVYYLKDKFTNCFYRIGTKEHFLLERMDGSRSLRALSDAYAAEFGRALNGRSWAGLLTLLEKRQLLENTANVTRLEELKREVDRRKRRENRGFLRRRFPLMQPDSFLEKLLPYFQFMFQRAFVLPALLCIVSLEVFVGFHISALVADAWAARSSSWNYLLFVLCVWSFTIIHELAHGLACKNFGGSVSEIGLIWRYFVIFPYCKLDDVLLFHKRWHRVYASFAGIFVNFLSVIPFALFWILAPVPSLLHAISALMLLSFNITIFIRVCPS
ncbi:M50 family peptidase [Ktedonosporobacter rubrisoli]|uniref:M50 family peptidase n=1 Tax=Ktedonosporobacter rubrisoli TaxID=2509675 RepID=A0A4P6K4Y7_KTERU|nr:M50 family metallopeptidase [Ktedonosporobacter rubrisoli]QBD82993.1 M50 family peptidase [Ktedonosporobacter rubrisoli]